MAQPTPYSRQYNFTNFQTVSPSSPLPAAYVDLEYNSLKLTLDQILNNLRLLQRDDTALANLSVGYDQLKPELNGFGFNPPTTWVTAHNYVVRDTIFNGAKFYQCLISHVSGTFATDLANGDWLLIADFNVNPVEVQTVAASAVTTIGDTDLIANVQTTGPVLKKITWANFKATVWAAIAALTGKTTPVGADTLLLSDSAASNVGKSLSFTNLWSATLAAFGPLIAALTAKTTPVDADGVLLTDSAATNAPKFLSWANLKAAIWAALGALMAAGTHKTAPVAADILAIADSAASNATKYATVAEVLATGTTVGAPAATTSGTAFDYVAPTGRTITRVTINFAGVSTNGSNSILAQLGASGSVEATGYLGSAGGVASGSTVAANYTTGLGLDGSGGATVVRHGSIVASLLDASTNTWSMTAVIGRSDAAVPQFSAASKSLAGTLDRVRITAGGDTFDAGKINVTWE